MKHVEKTSFWDELYQTESLEELPWFNRALDPDFDQELQARGIQGGTLWDIGTGPGTQALELARRGFKVTATDLSEAGIAIASSQPGASQIRFLVDNIVETRVSGSFEYAMDRGCYHVLPPKYRSHYVANLAARLRPGGLLFLKTFSTLQPETETGPYRMDQAEISASFQPEFRLESCRDTLFFGMGAEQPKALFCVLRRES